MSRAVIDASSSDLLRGHVIERPHHHAFLSHPGIDEARDAEIENLQHPFAVEHDVRWLDVTMDDARSVCVREAGTQILNQGKPPGRWAGTAFAAKRAVSVSPAMYSIAMKGRPSSSPTSWTTTMFGCRRRATDRASRMNRSRSFGSSWKSSFSSLIATSRSRRRIAREIEGAHAADAQATLDLVATDLTDVTARHVWRGLPMTSVNLLRADTPARLVYPPPRRTGGLLSPQRRLRPAVPFTPCGAAGSC